MPGLELPLGCGSAPKQMKMCTLKNRSHMISVFEKFKSPAQFISRPPPPPYPRYIRTVNLRYSSNVGYVIATAQLPNNRPYTENVMKFTIPENYEKVGHYHERNCKCYLLEINFIYFKFSF